MEMQLPSLKPREAQLESFAFQDDGGDFADVMRGPMTVKSQIAPKHPLEHVLKNGCQHQEAMQRSALMRAQGPAGPMIHAMELRSANSIGRLPFLQSSNLMRDVLTGKDGEIDFDDVFGLIPRSSERICLPHDVMEKAQLRRNAF